MAHRPAIQVLRQTCSGFDEEAAELDVIPNPSTQPPKPTSSPLSGPQDDEFLKELLGASYQPPRANSRVGDKASGRSNTPEISAARPPETLPHTPGRASSRPVHAASGTAPLLLASMHEASFPLRQFTVELLYLHSMCSILSGDCKTNLSSSCLHE